jgi:hypothetical protein
MLSCLGLGARLGAALAVATQGISSADVLCPHALLHCILLGLALRCGIIRLAGAMLRVGLVRCSSCCCCCCCCCCEPATSCRKAQHIAFHSGDVKHVLAASSTCKTSTLDWWVMPYYLSGLQEVFLVGGTGLDPLPHLEPWPWYLPTTPHPSHPPLSYCPAGVPPDGPPKPC